MENRKFSTAHAVVCFVACLSFSPLALAAAPEFKYLKDAIASSPVLTTFQKVAKYAYPPDWDKQVSRFAPVDGACNAEASAKLAAMSKGDARRYVEERSVLGQFVIVGSADPSVGKPLEVIMLSTTAFEEHLKEGQTWNLTSLAKTPITVRIVDGQVFVGGFKVDRENTINTDEGAVVALDGCDALH